MFVSEDGTVAGSIDVSRLDAVEPKTDEARAQLDALRRDQVQSQEAAVRDAERASQGERAVGINSTGRVDDEDGGEGGTEKSRAEQKADAERQQAEAEKQQGGPDQSGDEVKRLQAEAEAAGVTVDKRWGADRLRQEIDAAKSRKR